MKVIDCAQGSPEWFAARAGIATASCFADILAKGRGNEEAAARRNLRARLVVERLTGKVVETYKNAAIQQGTQREPFARSVFESRTGLFVDEVGFCRHDSLEAGASPDGLIDDHGGVEIKCPELAAHLEYLQLPHSVCPARYVAQVQGCMWITGRKWWNFVSYNPDFPENLQMVVRDVVRDDRYIAGLEIAVSLFMSEVAEEEAAVRKLAA